MLIWDRKFSVDLSAILIKHDVDKKIQTYVWNLELNRPTYLIANACIYDYIHFITSLSLSIFSV